MLGRDLIKEKKIDVWYDKVFVKHLVKKVQDIDPDIGAVLFPDQKLIVFFWKRIIIYKILMTKEQTNDLTIDYHLDKIRNVIRLLKLNLIPVKTLNSIKSRVKNIRLDYGKLI